VNITHVLQALRQRLCKDHWYSFVDVFISVHPFMPADSVTEKVEKVMSSSLWIIFPSKHLNDEVCHRYFCAKHS